MKPSSATPPRGEAEILAELQRLCTQPGFVHALAYLCFRDNMLVYSGQVAERDMHELHNPQRLSRTEIATLIGLMVKAPMDWALPAPAELQRYVNDSERLLLELHEALSAAFSFKEVLEGLERGVKVNPFDQGTVLREPIFYAAESAYSFQYLDMASRRYKADATWLQGNVGFTIDQACAVAEALDYTNNDRFESLRERLRGVHPNEWTILHAFAATPEEVAAHVGMDPRLVEHILTAFTLPPGDTNDRFVGIQDFNAVSATPLLRSPDGQFLSLQNTLSPRQFTSRRSSGCWRTRLTSRNASNIAASSPKISSPID